MALVRWNPAREMDHFQRDMNRFFSNHWGEREATENIAGNWTPAVNIFEDDDQYSVAVALPGLSQDDVTVNVENNMLTISGERELEHEEQREHYARIEQHYGSFNRSFTLPSTIDVGKIEAKMKDGVLSISLPKREETKPKSIAVKVN